LTLTTMLQTVDPVRVISP